MSDGVPREDVDDDKLFKADAWELVHDGVTSVRRLLVPGGWLYRTTAFYSGFDANHASTAIALAFVPDPMARENRS